VPHLPAGTVTFLFTDIEGSTRKWQNWSHKMKVALKRHDDILNKAVEASGGWVVTITGTGGMGKTRISLQTAVS
jgi:class 3 adenylate cyclase